MYDIDREQFRSNKTAVGGGLEFGLMASQGDDPFLGIDDIKESGDEYMLMKNSIDKDSKEEGVLGEKDMAHPTGNSIHRSGSRPQLDLSKAAIQGNFEEKDPTILLPNQSDDISHLALDIGGIFYLDEVYFICLIYNSYELLFFMVRNSYEVLVVQYLHVSLVVIVGVCICFCLPFFHWIIMLVYSSHEIFI